MNDKALEVLNGTGFPFQHHCAEMIAAIDGYQVSMEVPYTDPPTNGPLLGVDGQIDILAIHPDTTNNFLASFIIECKRANEKIKNWILIPNKQQKPTWPTFMVSGNGQAQPPPLIVNRDSRFSALGYTSGADFDYCINGIELNTHLQAINRDASEKIYKPLQQVSHGAHAFETMNPKVVEGLDYLRDGSGRANLYLPVILTTANLYLAEFAPEKVLDGDIQTGGLDLGRPRKWLTYEFPLPDHLGYKTSRQGGGNLAVAKRTVFMVNDEHLEEFFKGALDVVISNSPPVPTP